jgi:DNA-binding beta-propeller fold protein YncE
LCFDFVFCVLCLCVSCCLVQSIKGEIVLAVGSEGEDLGQFQDLRGLTLTPDERRLLVCDAGNHRVVVANAGDGRSLGELRGPADTLDCPVAVVIVPQTGQVLVLDLHRCLVVVFSGVDDDTLAHTIGDGAGDGLRQLQDPWGLSVLDGDVADAVAPDGPVAVVADSGNHRLSLFRVRDGSLMRHLGSAGDAPGQFNRPSAVTVVPARATGNEEAWLVVADDNNIRVQVLNRTGMVVRILQGDAVVELSSNLCGVTVCVATGEVLVTDSDNHRVVSWRVADASGLRVVCAGVKGMEFDDSDVEQDTGLVIFPWGVVVSGDGALWVADYVSNRLCLFR